MNVLIIGGGGRENAFLREILKASNVAMFCDSPNALMRRLVTDIGEFNLANCAILLEKYQIDLVIFGPEKPLVAGLADEVRKHGRLAFGPDRAAARLEGSKIFAKEFMQEFGLPTAKAVKVRSVEELKYTCSNFTPPYVLKADGLCAGKGVFICKDLEELIAAGRKLFEERIFGDQGSMALLEQYEPGEEVSYLFLTNGEDAVPLPMFRDHKRLGDGDKGPNTGGMGVIGPVNLNSKLNTQIHEEILLPTLKGFKARGFDYRGVVFVGIMLTPFGPKILEYNVRFGDPETQGILPLLDSSKGHNWLEVFTAIAEGKSPKVAWRSHRTAACVVAAAPGYPDQPKTGASIEGDPFFSSTDSYVLHAGTSEVDSKIVTAGGRVLNFVGLGATYADALKNAYAVSEKCQFQSMQMRKDIGKSVLNQKP